MELLPFLALIALMTWVAVIRPQRAMRRRQEDLVRRLSPGDEIVTVGGLYGTVDSVADDTLELEVSPGVLVRVDRRAVAQILMDRPEDADRGETDPSIEASHDPSDDLPSDADDEPPLRSPAP